MQPYTSDEKSVKRWPEKSDSDHAEEKRYNSLNTDNEGCNGGQSKMKQSAQEQASTNKGVSGPTKINWR